MCPLLGFCVGVPSVADEDPKVQEDSRGEEGNQSRREEEKRTRTYSEMKSRSRPSDLSDEGDRPLRV